MSTAATEREEFGAISFLHLDENEVTQLMEILKRWTPRIRLPSVRRSLAELQSRNSHFLVLLIHRNQQRVRDLQAEEPGMLAELRMFKTTTPDRSFDYFRIRTSIANLEQGLTTKNARMMELASESSDAIGILRDRGDLYATPEEDDRIQIVSPNDKDGNNVFKINFQD